MKTRVLQEKKEKGNYSSQPSMSLLHVFLEIHCTLFVSMFMNTYVYFQIDFPITI